jgi:hypothetical protein
VGSRSGFGGNEDSSDCCDHGRSSFVSIESVVGNCKADWRFLDRGMTIPISTTIASTIAKHTMKIRCLWFRSRYLTESPHPWGFVRMFVSTIQQPGSSGYCFVVLGGGGTRLTYIVCSNFSQKVVKCSRKLVVRAFVSPNCKIEKTKSQSRRPKNWYFRG